MDLLFTRYASPFEFMHPYIESGQFGLFVSKIIEMDNKRKQEEAEKENEKKLWELYLHSMSDKSFTDWKKDLYQSNQPNGHSMSDKQVDDTINKSRDILKSFKIK